MIRGEYLDISPEQLNKVCDYSTIEEIRDADLDLMQSDYFRTLCLQNGFHITKLYPVYHRGWELDEWGAIAVKDDRVFRLETNHGSLVTEQISSDAF